MTLQIQHGLLSEGNLQKYDWGTVRILMADYGKEHATARNITLNKNSSVNYSVWADNCEGVLVVEEGSGELYVGMITHKIAKGMAIHIPQHEAEKVQIKNTETQELSITCVTLAHEELPPLGSVQVVDPAQTPWKIFEYEALGRQGVVGASKRIGVLQLAFPIEQIPLHIHPHSDRFIRTISGQGFVYVEPYKYDMGANDAFIAFPRSQVHTNGPRPGNWWIIWSFHFPWIDPEVDEENVGGSEAYAKYLAAPPKALWKTKKELVDALTKHHNT